MLSAESNFAKTLVWEVASTPRYVGEFIGDWPLSFRDDSGPGGAVPGWQVRGRAVQ